MDADGIPDQTDNCLNIANPDQADLDGNGQGDVCDSDIDGDGVANDSDLFPRDSSETIDTDGDGIGDNGDNCPAIANPEQENADNDTAGDACDAFKNDPSETLDTDNDGIGNNADTDDDGDGVADIDDPFPLNSEEWADVDEDGVGDNADLHLNNTSQNAYQLTRLWETGKAIRFIAPGPESDRFGDFFGARVSSAGDVNGDDLDDLLIGFAAYQDGDIYYGGLVILLFGREQGWPNTIDMGNLDSTDLEYLFIHSMPGEPNFGNGLGIDVTGVGDVNKDGFDDFFVGSSFKDYGEEMSAGEVYLIFGRESFPKTDMTINEIKQDYAITYYGEEQFGGLGNVVASLGDVNGDTYPDFIMGELQYDLTPGGDEGRSIVIFGGEHLQPPSNSNPISIDPDSLDTTQSAFIHNTPLSLKDRNARVVGISDFNDDGYDDIAIARPELLSNGKRGMVSVIWGRQNWTQAIDLNNMDINDGLSIVPVSSESDENPGLGKNLAVGDINGNGHKDLMMSGYGITDNDRIYIVYGGRQAWPNQVIASELLTDQGGMIKTDHRALLGYAMAVLPDTNGDGMDELLASAYRKEDSDLEDFLSRVYRFDGRKDWSDITLKIDNDPKDVEYIEHLWLSGLGGNIVTVGDYNQDGVPEFVVDDDIRVKEYDGQDLSERKTHFYLVLGGYSQSKVGEVNP
ncbi:hypothetical protein HF888_07260 [Bermanella marisrubri]|nr:hypothetical protein HF888_07260 [Bermanella marisrubri]